MSRTRRNIKHAKSLRRPQTARELRQQAMLRELVREACVNLGNRALLREVVSAWDDICVSAWTESWQPKA